MLHGALETYGRRCSVDLGNISEDVFVIGWAPGDPEVRAIN